MLLLLPPSEGKCAPPPGHRLDLARLSFPSLTPGRRTALAALIDLCRDEPVALRALGLSARQRDEVAQNRLLTRAPVDAAVRVYTGVLYEALDPGSLTPAHLRRLDAHVAIASALWGLVRPLDPIPAYRLSAGRTVPGLVAGLWREPIGDVLRNQPGPIVDLRSGAYRTLAPLPTDVDAVTARILLERDGDLSVVSHHNKAVKGRLVRAIARSRRAIRTVEDVADVAAGIGLRVEEVTSGPTRSPARRLDLITTAV